MKPETGRRGAQETGSLGDGETGSLGDGETGKPGDGETGRPGDGETGRPGDGASADSQGPGRPAEAAADGPGADPELTDEERLVLNLLREQSPADLNELKGKTGLSNKKWDTAIKVLRAKELAKVEKNEEGLFVSLV